MPWPRPAVELFDHAHRPALKTAFGGLSHAHSTAPFRATALGTYNHAPFFLIGTPLAVRLPPNWLKELRSGRGRHRKHRADIKTSVKSFDRWKFTSDGWRTSEGASRMSDLISVGRIKSFCFLDSWIYSPVTQTPAWGYCSYLLCFKRWQSAWWVAFLSVLHVNTEE